VCLSVCSHISKTTGLNLTRFPVRATCGRGSVVLVLWTTSCFHIAGQWVRIGDDIVSSSSPGGGTKDEISVSGMRDELSAVIGCALHRSGGVIW